jgi:hypothetical protein
MRKIIAGAALVAGARTAMADPLHHDHGRFYHDHDNFPGRDH